MRQSGPRRPLDHDGKGADPRSSPAHQPLIPLQQLPHRLAALRVGYSVNRFTSFALRAVSPAATWPLM